MKENKCKIMDCNRKDIKSKESGLCSIHYARLYRKENKDKIRPVSQARYLKDREKNLKYSREWARNHPEEIREHKRKQYIREKELMFIRQKTIRIFSELKNKSTCKVCGTKENLEFHHLKPYAFDNFEILCTTHHMKAHGRLIVETKVIRNGGVKKKNGR